MEGAAAAGEAAAAAEVALRVEAAAAAAKGLPVAPAADQALEADLRGPEVHLKLAGDRGMPARTSSHRAACLLLRGAAYGPDAARHLVTVMATTDTAVRSPAFQPSPLASGPSIGSPRTRTDRHPTTRRGPEGISSLLDSARHRETTAHTSSTGTIKACKRWFLFSTNNAPRSIPQPRLT